MEDLIRSVLWDDHETYAIKEDAQLYVSILATFDSVMYEAGISCTDRCMKQDYSQKAINQEARVCGVRGICSEKGPV